jgi:hypothetical protein
VELVQRKLYTILIGYIVTVQINFKDSIWVVIVDGGCIEVVIRVESKILP